MDQNGRPGSFAGNDHVVFNASTPAWGTGTINLPIRGWGRRIDGSAPEPIARAFEEKAMRFPVLSADMLHQNEFCPTHGDAADRRPAAIRPLW